MTKQYEEWLKRVKEEKADYGPVSLSDILKMEPLPRLCSYDDEGFTVYGPYEYFIEKERMRSKADLLEWIHHLAPKTWINTYHIYDLITCVSEVKWWPIYGGTGEGV